jgi:hypothetical protein
MFQERRHDQLIAKTTRSIKAQPTQFFNVPRLRRQNIRNVIRQNPGSHESEVMLKKGFYRSVDALGK